MNLGLSPDLGSRRNAASITGFIGSAVVDNTGTSTVVNMPVTAQSGDFIVMLGASNTAGNEVTPPAGWSTPVNTGGLSFAYRTHDGSPSYTFTVGGSIQHTVLIVVVRGYSFGVAGAAFSALAADPVASSITVPANNSLNLNLVASTAGGISWSMPAGWTARTASNTGRSVGAFQRDALVASGVLAGTTATRTAGAASGRALQLTLSPV